MRDVNSAELYVDDEDDVIGCLPPILTPSHRQEIDTAVNSLPLIIESGDLSRIENNVERYCKILKLYLEQPNLLDSYIPILVEKLLAYINLPIYESSPCELNKLTDAALEYLEHLTTVRGEKVISRLLPHEVSYLDRILLALENMPSVVEDGLRQRRMLLLWIWIVCKNPFDMRRFDKKDCPGSTMNRIFSAVEPYLLGNMSRCHHLAALVLAQCIARTDGLSLLNKSIDTCISHLSSEENLLRGLILLSGLLKHVDRSHLISHAERIVSATKPFFPLTSPNVLVRKFLIKTIQRIALCLLKPKIASWRYRRGKRSLEDSLACVDKNNVSNGTHEIDDEDVNYNVSHHVEWVLSCLLEAIKDEDTSVRWSASKGIGRICSRLPKDLATQVIDAIVGNNFHRLAGHCSWHGGCMSLAELARKGFLLPTTLPKVFEIVQLALFYEEPMGRHALGSNVRDAACYILWAFARSYEPEDLRPYLEKIAISLMCQILFDRELRLRRAASAAFQENVGRQTNFPDGIALLTKVDYYAVGNRERCYTQIAKEVSRFPKYAHPIIDHLINKKVVHWDISIRQQAALALQEISALHGEYLSTKIVQLLESCTTNNFIQMHGSLIALAHVVKGLVGNGNGVPQDILLRVVNLPEELKNDFTNQRVGELTRLALIEFICVLSSAEISLNETQIQTWMSLLEVACVDRNPNLRKGAANAASVFVKQYFKSSSKMRDNAKTKIMSEIQSATIETRRVGFCALAGTFPSDAVDDELFQTLCFTVLKQSPRDKQWALAREAAIEAITNIVISEYKQHWTILCFETLMAGLNDYTKDIHGDVGRFVRQQSMHGLTDILICDKTPDSTIKECTLIAVKLMIQQSAETIGRTRETACNCIKILVHNSRTKSQIPHEEMLASLYNEGLDFIQDKSLLKLTTLFTCDEYYADIIQGLVLSAGGISEVTGRYSAEAFLAYQESLGNNFSLIEKLVSAVASLFEKGKTIPRISEAVLRFLPQLLTRLPTVENFVDNSKGIDKIVQRLKRLLAIPNLSPVRMKMILRAFSSFLLANPTSHIWQTSVRVLAETLSNQLPIIRRVAAEALLESIWAIDVDEKVITLLSETHWQDTNDLPAILEAATSIQNILITV